MQSPTTKQCEVLRVFAQRDEVRLPAPTLRELCQIFGWRSTGTSRDHIRALARQGLLEKVHHGSRNWRLSAAGIELVRKYSLVK
jgi:SOS-response transcriptional repressor LexA